ncbi:ABC transporter substrate-binding protein [Nonomuraea bangladeshensis]|uniref:ABC transporter substrate-binding protein n=1 Tax=Nonomuraea bangladeshensis TaxID=404385 RepID=UPI0031D8ACA8
MAAVACSSAPETTSAAGLAKPLTKIQVGYMPIPDVAPLFIAREAGYFRLEGLDVEPIMVQGGGPGADLLEAGTLQFSIMNYTSAVYAEAAKPGELKIVADCYQSTPNSFKIMVAAGSPITSLQQLKGKHISVITLASVGTLTLKNALAVAGLTIDDVEVSQAPLPDMLQKLKSGIIDAAWMAEPYVTLAGETIGAKGLYDPMSNRTADWPVAGWAASSKYIEKNPDIIRRWNRAMARAQRDAASDGMAVRRILRSYTKIEPRTAATITLGVYPTSLNAARIQRVADLMYEFRDIKKPVDVRSFLEQLPVPVPTPAEPTS